MFFEFKKERTMLTNIKILMVFDEDIVNLNYAEINSNKLLLNNIF